MRLQQLEALVDQTLQIVVHTFTIFFPEINRMDARREILFVLHLQNYAMDLD
jgi:hypothetical protein